MILDKACRTIKQFDLFPGGGRVLVACSGGADSVCLLAVLFELREQLKLDLYVGHFNHKLRLESDQDEAFVKDLAAKYELAFYSGAEEVKTWAAAKSQNLEEAGRELRYAFLEKTAQNIGGAKIATAHTRTDQAETVLMRLLRGAGTRGMAGIYPKIDNRIVRPLIAVERPEIEAYLREKKIDFRIDRTNFDPDFLRNRIRMELLPHLLREYDPGLIARLGQAAEIFREEEAVMEESAISRIGSLLQGELPDLRLSLDGLKSLPLALQRRIVRLYLYRLRGDLREVSFADINTILTLGRGKEFCLEQGLILQNEKGCLFQTEKTGPSLSYNYSWLGQKPLIVTEADLRFSAENISAPDISEIPFNNNFCAYLDRNKLSFPLTVRSRQEGDRYVPLGAPGRVKLKEAFRAKAIPRKMRDRCPVFLCGQEIIWVLGLPAAEKFKLDDSTSDVFCIKKII